MLATEEEVGQLEDEESIEAESLAWQDPPTYDGIVLGHAIRRVMRDTRLSALQLACLCGVSKTVFFKRKRGDRCKRPLAEYLFGKLAEIYLEHVAA